MAQQSYERCATRKEAPRTRTLHRASTASGLYLRQQRPSRTACETGSFPPACRFTLALHAFGKLLSSRLAIPLLERLVRDFSLHEKLGKLTALSLTFEGHVLFAVYRRNTRTEEAQSLNVSWVHGPRTSCRFATFSSPTSAAQPL